jgi:hypothetical protein
MWISNCHFSRRIQDCATLRGAKRLTYADARMGNLLLTLLHRVVVTAKLCGPGIWASSAPVRERR